MLFKLKYPDSKRGNAPESDIFHSEGFYSCDSCHKITPWRFLPKLTGHHMPCCSEECKQALEKQYEENP